MHTFKVQAMRPKTGEGRSISDRVMLICTGSQPSRDQGQAGDHIALTACCGAVLYSRELECGA